MKKSLYIVFLLLLPLLLASAEAPNGLAFLKISTDVRASGMGETGVVAGDNRSALSFNPALLSNSSGNAIYLSHHQWILDAQINYLQVQFHSWIDIGFSALSTGVEDIELRATPSPEPIAYFDSHDLALGMTFSRQVNADFSLGASVKFIQERIFDAHSEGYGCDFGVLYKFNHKVAVGGALLNIGKMSPMAAEKPDLPLIGRYGISYQQKVKPLGELLVAFGWTYIRDEDWKGNLGLEWKPIEMLSLRSGYLLNYDERSYALGLGLKYGKFSLDYGFLPFQSGLGEAQRLAVMVEF